MRPFRGKPRPVAPNPANTDSRVVDKFLERVRISYRADNRLVDVGYESADPKLAAAVANALAQRYIHQNLDLKVQAAKEASIWLNQRLAEQKRRVEESEGALQRYRDAHADVATSQRQNVTAQKLSELSTAATRARTERIAAEALLDEIQRVSENPAADATPLSAPNPLIQQLRQELMTLQRQEAELAQRLGSLHPDLVAVRTSIARVEAQLKDETSRLAESVRKEAAAARYRERSLTDALAAQEQVTLALDRRGMQYDTLQRDLESNRQLFDALRERAKQTEISSELKIANVQIIDPAEVPRQPDAPRPVLVLALALLIGVPLGLGTAFGVEYTDTRIKSPEDIRTLLGVDFLGFAPKVSEIKQPGRGGVTGGDVFAEAVRGIRTNVLVAISRRGPKSLVVTSTRAGEGKTVIATNLAIALAQAGRSVLLVDADMRKSQVHEVFEMPVAPGLAEVLESAVSIQDALHTSVVPGLTVLTAGSPGTSPGDLLVKKSIRAALAPLPHSIDWIVIDTPPLRAASDAIALAQDENAVIFVVGADTNWRGARSALHELLAGSVNVLGAVISRADMGRMPSEYAFDYSYYEQGAPQ
jgi:capsular exopolysaccharide synthesis family protein